MRKITYMCLAGLLASTTVYADFGALYQKEHKRSPNQPAPSTPFAPLAPVAPAARPQMIKFPEMIDLLNRHHQGAVEQILGGHVNQADLEALPPAQAFQEAFAEGDELFEIKYNALDGVGVNVGNGNRFTSVPRPDLASWANVMPHRITGPNSDSCANCHSFPVADGAGVVNDNAVRIDPERLQNGFIERQSPHIHGMGAQQLLAQEMTTDLQALRDSTIFASCAARQPRTATLVTKGINFGSISVNCRTVNYAGVRGIDPSLVVKPFEWKGLTASVRDFARGASHQELGMQAVELVDTADADFDGVTEELSVGDITALSVYMAAQPRPTSKVELNQVANQLSVEQREAYGLPLTSAQIGAIGRGQNLMVEMRCTQCHVPALIVKSPTFFEPSRHAAYRDAVFPAGSAVRMPQVPMQFNITTDLPNNPQLLPNGRTLGVFEKNPAGEAIVRLYGDLKRHDMGYEMAEAFDEGNVGASTFITETLWGVGSTPPYLHDGRATTLTEAILYHGGEAAQSKTAFVNASAAQQADLLAFLNNLVIFLD